MRKSVYYVLTILLAGAAIVQARSGRQGSELELQQRLEQGGKHWSAPKSARDLTYNLTGGDRLWLWPPTDAVLEVSRSNPRLTLLCRLRSPLGAQETFADLKWTVQIFARRTSFRSGTWIAASGAIVGSGTEDAADRCDITLNELVERTTGEGWVLLAVSDSAGHPVSNLLRVEIRVVEGALTYRPDAVRPTRPWNVQLLAGQSSGAADVVFNVRGNLLLSAGADGRIAVWDVPSKQLIARSSFKQGGHPSLVRSEDGALMLAWSDDDARIRVFETATLRLVYEIALPGGPRVLRAKFIPGSHKVAVLSAKVKRIDRYSSRLENRQISTWDPDNNKPLGAVDAGEHAAVDDDLVFSHDGLNMTSWFAEEVQLWDVSTLKPTGPAFSPVRRPLMHIEFADNDKSLRLIDHAKTMALWQIETRSILREFNFSSGRDVASADIGGMTLAVSDGRNVVLWDLNTGQVNDAPLTGHPDDAPIVAFSADGATLAAGSVRHVMVWDVSTRNAIGECVLDGGVLPKDRWVLDINRDGSAVAVGRSDRSEIALCVRPRSDRSATGSR